MVASALASPVRYLIALFALGLIAVLSGCGGAGKNSLPPEAPTFSSTTPMLPVNTDDNPRINGSAPAGATVRLFTSPDCSGSAAVTGTAPASGSFALGARVPTNSTTTFHATATDSNGTSACSSDAIAYTYSGPVTGVTCDKVASTTGSDSAAGTLTSPYRTALHLVESLSDGQTGCLRGGYYVDNVDIRAPNATLTSYPGEHATLQGFLFVAPSASGVIVSSLTLNGNDGNADSGSPVIDAADVTFRDDDVTNDHTSICFTLGYPANGYGPATNTLIQNNNIHDCGVLPAANHDHGIYLDFSSGVRVLGNWIHDNANRGVQLYPNGDHSLIEGNVIDSNGEGIVFSNDYDESRSPALGVYQTSDDNLAQHNVITNSLHGFNVEAAPDVHENHDGDLPVMPHPSGNVVRDNCLFTTQSGHGGIPSGSGIADHRIGFTAPRNLVVDPQYVNAAAGDYHLGPGSPCSSILAG
jgi:hypothetical protein